MGVQEYDFKIVHKDKTRWACEIQKDKGKESRVAYINEKMRVKKIRRDGLAFPF